MLRWLFGRRFTIWDVVWFGIAFHSWQVHGVITGLLIWVLALLVGCGGEFLLANYNRS